MVIRIILKETIIAQWLMEKQGYCHFRFYMCKEILKFFPKVKNKIVVINRGIDTNYFDPESINETRKLNAISSLGIHESPHILSFAD